MLKLSNVEIAADQRWQDYVHPAILSSYEGMCGVFRQNQIKNVDRFIHVQSFLDEIENYCKSHVWSKSIIYLRFELKTKVLECILFRIPWYIP